jgi:hypothetical protein
MVDQRSTDADRSFVQRMLEAPEDVPVLQQLLDEDARDKSQEPHSIPPAAPSQAVPIRSRRRPDCLRPADHSWIDDPNDGADAFPIGSEIWETGANETDSNQQDPT